MSTLRTITDFKSKLIGGARPNLFEVELPAFPAAATASGAIWGTASGADRIIQVSKDLLHCPHQTHGTYRSSL